MFPFIFVCNAQNYTKMNQIPKNYFLIWRHKSGFSFHHIIRKVLITEDIMLR